MVCGKFDGYCDLFVVFYELICVWEGEWFVWDFYYLIEYSDYVCDVGVFVWKMIVVWLVLDYCGWDYFCEGGLIVGLDGVDVLFGGIDVWYGGFCFGGLISDCGDGVRLGCVVYYGMVDNGLINWVMWWGLVYFVVENG